MSRISKIEIVYKFFKERFDKSSTFTIYDITQETKWQSSTVITYINKIWKPFIDHDNGGFKLNANFKRIDIKKFKELHNQKRYKNTNDATLTSLIEKAINFSKIAISIYNNPFIKLRAHGYIVNMIIAWSALFHAFFYKNGTDFFYKKDGKDVYVDGAKKAWEISECIKKFYQSDNNAIRANLLMLIKLRNPIEHSFLPEITLNIEGHFQACLLNFEEFILEHFGSEFAIADGLALALQLTNYNADNFTESYKSLQAESYENIKGIMDDFEGKLSDEILKSAKYRLRFYLTPKTSKSKSSADKSIEFVKDEDVQLKLATIINEKTLEKVIKKPEYEFKPGNVVKKIVGAGIHFNLNMHANAWKKHNVRPQKATKDSSFEEKYANWCPFRECVTYNNEWVSLLLSNLNTNPDFYKSGIGGEI